MQRTLALGACLAAALATIGLTQVQAAGPGSGGAISIGGGSRGGYWEGRLRIIHHYYDLLPDYATFQTVTGSTQSQCNTSLIAARAALIANPDYSTAQIEYDYYCAWRP